MPDLWGESVNCEWLSLCIWVRYTQWPFIPCFSNAVQTFSRTRQFQAAFYFIFYEDIITVSGRGCAHRSHAMADSRANVDGWFRSWRVKKAGRLLFMPLQIKRRHHRGPLPEPPVMSAHKKRKVSKDRGTMFPPVELSHVSIYIVPSCITLDTTGPSKSIPTASHSVTRAQRPHTSSAYTRTPPKHILTHTLHHHTAHLHVHTCTPQWHIHIHCHKHTPLTHMHTSPS